MRDNGGAARHEGFLRHGGFRYLKLALLLSLAAILGYLFIEVEPRHNGGSWYGYLLGTVATLLVLWLTALGIRKRAITAGRWSLKSWTSAHVYLGLCVLLLATLHAGFQFGWNLHTLAYALMVIVVLTGIWGIYLYASIPRRMSDNRAETTQSEMLEEIRALDRELGEQAKTLDDAQVQIVRKSIADTKLGGSVFARLRRRPAHCATDAALIDLRNAQSGLGEEKRAALSQVINALERKASMLTRARRHIRYRALLELWLYFHVPLTVALLAALLVHILSVFIYW